MTLKLIGSPRWNLAVSVFWSVVELTTWGESRCVLRLPKKCLVFQQGFVWVCGVSGTMTPDKNWEG